MERFSKPIRRKLKSLFENISRVFEFIFSKPFKSPESFESTEDFKRRRLVIRGLFSFLILSLFKRSSILQITSVSSNEEKISLLETTEDVDYLIKNGESFGGELKILEGLGEEDLRKELKELRKILKVENINNQECQEAYERICSILSSKPSPSPTQIPTPTPTPEPQPTPSIQNISPKESFNQEKPISTEVIYYGKPGTKKVAITFDDFPNPKILRDLLEFCKNHQIHMVWFIIGRTMNDEAAQIIREGIETGLIRIGNHSFSHNISEFSKLNKEYIESEKSRWIEEMKNYGFEDEILRYYFRPPGGAGGYRGGDKRLLSVLSENNYKYLVMWDVEFIYTTRVKSLEYTPENLKGIALSRIRYTNGGNLVLAHFNRTDVEAIKNLIIELINEGYEFVFPEQLLN